jgi:dipeptidyl aminopeptidase/acylaminoacyl peptidase
MPGNVCIIFDEENWVMRIVRIFLVMSLGLCITSEGGAQQNKLKLMDIFHLEHASDPQISPNGKRVLFVRHGMDIMKDKQRASLWSVHADGTDHRPFTSGDRKAMSPRWSLDGKRVVYVVEAEGRFELRCRWIEGGQDGKLADLEFPPVGLAWSPDGKQLAFSMFVARKSKPFIELPTPPKGAQWADPPKIIRNVAFRLDGKGYLKDGFQQLFVLPGDGGTPRQITSAEVHHGEGPVWAPDAKSLIFSANMDKEWELDPLNSEIYEASLSDGQVKNLTQRSGPDHSPAISPDGQHIAYVGFEDKRQGYQVSQLYLMDRDGSKSRVLTPKLDRDVKNPVWNQDGKGLYFQYDDQGTTRIAQVNLEGKLRNLATNVGGTTLDRPYASGSFSVAHDGSIAFTFTRPEHPADVAVVDSSQVISPLTSLNADLFEQKKLGATEEIWLKSAHDGRRVHAWLTKPPDFDAKKKYPLILEIHGGPFANYGPRFAASMQLFAAAGYVVLYVNPRGSTSYGEEFGNLIHHNYPGNDYDDLMSSVDEVVKRGYIDENNLFVTGGSGGGILSAWIIGKTNRFRAAVVGKPVINWFSFVLTADIYPFFNRYWFPGYPWEHAEHYLKRSPISLAGNIATPTMIITGEDDHRTPMSESEQLYQALKLRKVDAALVRIPGASHNVAARPSQLMAWVGCTLRWFEEHKTK